MAVPLSPSRRVARAVAPLRGGGSIARPSRNPASVRCPGDSDRFVVGCGGAGRRLRDGLLAAIHGFPPRGQGVGRVFVHVRSVGEADVVLAASRGLGCWTYLARNPAVDFPAAHWTNAKFVRIAIGFHCTAGLAGASYSMYFDDFMLDTGAGDADGDGLSDLDEETR